MSAPTHALLEQELCQRIDEVLFYVWDPLGLAREPAEREEYMAFVPELFALLAEDAGVPVLVEYLVQTEADVLGCSPRPSQARRVADMLCEWKELLERKYGAAILG